MAKVIKITIIEAGLCVPKRGRTPRLSGNKKILFLPYEDFIVPPTWLAAARLLFDGTPARTRCWDEEMGT